MTKTKKKTLNVILGIGVGIAFLVALLPVLFFGFLIFVFSFPTNDRDNARSDKSSMIECTLLWGRLTHFPTTARDFTIYTEGNSFARTFRGSFVDTRENIEKWLAACPGFVEGKEDRSEGVRVLKMGEGASYGTIEVSEEGTKVTFRVSWS